MRNKFACPHVNAAYERALAAFQELEPPSFGMFPTADDFQNAAELFDLQSKRSAWITAMDEFIHAIAAEANANARSNISTNDRMSIFSNAVHDSGLAGDLSEEAYALSEEAA